MGALKGDIGDSAIHLCIDMQRLFATDGPWPTPWLSRVLPVVVSIVERAASRTIFTRFIPPHVPEQAGGKWRDYFEKWREVTQTTMASERLELVPPLDRFVPPAKTFDKPVYSAFAGGALHALLRAAEIDTLIITGAETDVCVLSTVLSAVDIGYRIIVVKDALCSSSDASHDALLNLYATRFDLQIELATAAEALASWRP